MIKKGLAALALAAGVAGLSGCQQYGGSDYVTVHHVYVHHHYFHMHSPLYHHSYVYHSPRIGTRYRSSFRSGFGRY